MTLKVGVLVKQVPDLEAIVQVAPSGELDIEDRWVCSFFDEIAIQAAVNLKKAAGDVELVALGLGGPKCVDALRRAVAMGIDNVERVGGDEMEAADGLTVAGALAARLAQIEVDIVLCGKQATDDDMGAVGPMVAAKLQARCISSAVSLGLDTGSRKLTATRRVEGALLTVVSSLPVVVTAEKGLAEPVIPVVMRVMKAMKARVTNVPLADLGIDAVGFETGLRRDGYDPPRARPQVEMLKTVEDLVAALEQRGVLS